VVKCQGSQTTEIDGGRGPGCGSSAGPGPRCGYRALGAKMTLVVHEMKRLGRGALELLKVVEALRDAGIELEFLAGPLQGSLKQFLPGEYGIS
jgi:hypothetical protein